MVEERPPPKARTQAGKQAALLGNWGTFKDNSWLTFPFNSRSLLEPSTSLFSFLHRTTLIAPTPLPTTHIPLGVQLHLEAGRLTGAGNGQPCTPVPCQASKG